VGDGFKVSAQLRISSSSSHASSWEYHITGVITLGLIRGKGVSLVWPSVASIGKAIAALCWDGGDNGGLFSGIELTVCPCTTSLVVGLVWGTY